MAPQPQRSAEPHHLNAAVVPVERALLARAAMIEKVYQDKGDATAIDVALLHVAKEFRAFAAELHHW